MDLNLALPCPNCFVASSKAVIVGSKLRRQSSEENRPVEHFLSCRSPAHLVCKLTNSPSIGPDILLETSGYLSIKAP